MLTVEKWLEERLSPGEPSEISAARVARLAEPVKSSVSCRWFSVPLASGVGNAVLLYPKNIATTRQSLVILLHALGRESVAFEWQWAQALVSKGIPVLAVEWDGHGDGSSLWDVASVSRTVPLILHKLYAGWGEQQMSPASSFPKCFLMGNSFGGTLALLTAARPEIGNVVSGIVVISPMVALVGTHFDGSPRKRFGGGFRALKRNRFSIGMGVDPFDQVRAFLADTVERRGVLKQVRVPVLWMHGARDRLVPVDAAMRHMTCIPSALFAHIDETRGHKLMNASVEIADYASRFIERCVDSDA